MLSIKSSTYSGLSCSCCVDMLSLTRSRRDFLRGAAGVGFAAFLAPQFSFAASGEYEAMLLSCIDPRFQKLVFDRQIKEGLSDKYSAFTVAGASIGVVAPAFKAWQETFWENLAASIQLHNIKQVIVVNHRDCGAAKIAYGQAAVATPAAETETHKNALLKFKKELAARQPKMASQLGLMALNGKVEIFS
jgi:carbonic anhydrase